MMSQPCSKTMREISDLMAKELCANCIRQILAEDGDIIQYWNVGGHVVITHAYSGLNGWTHYLPSKRHTLDELADEIRNYLVPEDKPQEPDCMRKFFAESPSRTRIREFESGDSEEFIARVKVTIETGDVGFSNVELSRMATDLLVARLKELSIYSK